MSNDNGTTYWCNQYHQLDAQSKAKILELEQRVNLLKDAIRPFMLIVTTSEGMIPTERLSFANWHELIKAYNQTPQQASEQIECWHIEWMLKLDSAYDAIYAAWHGAGVDIAGGDWNRFANMLPECRLLPPLPKETK